MIQKHKWMFCLLILFSLSLVACSSDKPKYLNWSMDTIIDEIDEFTKLSYQTENISLTEKNDIVVDLKNVLSDIDFKPVEENQSKEENIPSKLHIRLSDNQLNEIYLYFIDNGETTKVEATTWKLKRGASSIHVPLGESENIYEISNKDFDKILEVVKP